MRESLEKKKIRTSTGFEPVTSRYRCYALTNKGMTPLMLGVGQSCVHIESPVKEMNVKDVYEISYKNCINCVHNCEDDSSFDFISAVLI